MRFAPSQYVRNRNGLDHVSREGFRNCNDATELYLWRSERLASLKRKKKVSLVLLTFFSLHIGGYNFLSAVDLVNLICERADLDQLVNILEISSAWKT